MKRFAVCCLSFVNFVLFGVLPVAQADVLGGQPRQPLATSALLAEDEEPQSATSDEDGKEKDKEDKEEKSADADKKTDEAAESKPEEKSSSEKGDEKKSAETADKTATKGESKPAAKPEAKKRKTHKVEAKRFKVEVPLEGVFVAGKTTEVPLRPDAWTNFEIVEVVEHGQKVRSGETLVKFDDEDLSKAIADLELEQRLNELAIRRMEEELPRLEQSLKMDLDQSERGNREAQEDYKRYNEIERPQTVKSAEFMVKYYNFMLDYEKDELVELEKMYAADDLTEETEEVVLKRQRNAVEFAEYSLENVKIRRDETLNVQLPRYDIAIKESLERAEMALARAKLAWSIDLNRARYELEQRKEARDKSLDRHAKLLADRGLMEIKAPADGIVYYGQAVNGRWNETPSLINKYKPHSNLAPGSIVMTIVESRPIHITASIDEGKRPDVATGQKAMVALPADGVDQLTADVKSISAIPVSAGKFDIDFTLGQEAIPDWVVAGMTCKLSVKTHDKKDALTVPKAAVHDDEDDVNKKYVWVVPKDDAEAKAERRDVTIGKRSGDDVEIVKGLAAGDVVSLEDESKKTDE